MDRLQYTSVLVCWARELPGAPLPSAESAKASGTTRGMLHRRFVLCHSPHPTIALHPVTDVVTESPGNGDGVDGMECRGRSPKEPAAVIHTKASWEFALN